MLGHCHEGVMEWFSLFFSAFGPREALLEAMFGRAPSTTALVGEAQEPSLGLFRQIPSRLAPKRHFRLSESRKLECARDILEITLPCRPPRRGTPGHTSLRHVAILESSVQ